MQLAELNFLEASCQNPWVVSHFGGLSQLLGSFIFHSLSYSITVPQSMKLGIDVNRHKEIIVKAISALLLLLLKHFKLNHVYQVIGKIKFYW